MERIERHVLNSELIKLSISEKNGMTCAIMNAITHVAARMTVQTTHATTELEWRCPEFLKTRKKMKRDVIDCNIACQMSSLKGAGTY